MATLAGQRAQFTWALNQYNLAEDAEKKAYFAQRMAKYITAALMFTLLPLAWVMVNMPRTAANRELIYTLHKSLGLTVLALVAARLFWRAIHPAPQLPGSLFISSCSACR
jgi:cytochrome b561